MSAELLIANLFRIAAHNLDGARTLGDNRRAIYRCEQAAEKFIRAVLTSEGKHAGIKHDLFELVDMTPDENPIKPDLRAIQHLSKYATSYRYPVAASPTKRIPESPDSLELQSAIAKTATALQKTIAAFATDINSNDAPAGSRGPIR